MQWLLEHGGSSITERSKFGLSVWDLLYHSAELPPFDSASATVLSSLLRVMVLHEDPPAPFYVELAAEHVRVVEEGARLRARLPAYLTRRRALQNEQCPLIPPLRALIRDYDPEPTTTEEIWATGLGAEP
jgi:hypothetical protein